MKNLIKTSFTIISISVISCNAKVLSELQIDRRILSANYQSIQLHSFADASEVAINLRNEMKTNFDKILSKKAESGYGNYIRGTVD